MRMTNKRKAQRTVKAQQESQINVISNKKGLVEITQQRRKVMAKLKNARKSKSNKEAVAKLKKKYENVEDADIEQKFEEFVRVNAELIQLSPKVLDIKIEDVRARMEELRNAAKKNDTFKAHPKMNKAAWMLHIANDPDRETILETLENGVQVEGEIVQSHYWQEIDDVTKLQELDTPIDFVNVPEDLSHPKEEDRELYEIVWKKTKKQMEEGIIKKINEPTTLHRRFPLPKYSSSGQLLKVRLIDDLRKSNLSKSPKQFIGLPSIPQIKSMFYLAATGYDLEQMNSPRGTVDCMPAPVFKATNILANDTCVIATDIADAYPSIKVAKSSLGTNTFSAYNTDKNEWEHFESSSLLFGSNRSPYAFNMLSQCAARIANMILTGHYPLPEDTKKVEGCNACKAFGEACHNHSIAYKTKVKTFYDDLFGAVSSKYKQELLSTLEEVLQILGFRVAYQKSQMGKDENILGFNIRFDKKSNIPMFGPTQESVDMISQLTISMATKGVKPQTKTIQRILGVLAFTSYARGSQDFELKRAIRQLGKMIKSNTGQQWKGIFKNIGKSVYYWAKQETIANIPRLRAFHMTPTLVASDASWTGNEGMLGGVIFNRNGAPAMKWAIAIEAQPAEAEKFPYIAILEMIACVITLEYCQDSDRILALVDSAVALAVLKRKTSWSNILQTLSSIMDRIDLGVLIEFRYIPSKVNIADILTRLSRHSDLLDSIPFTKVANSLIFALVRKVSESEKEQGQNDVLSDWIASWKVHSREGQWKSIKERVVPLAQQYSLRHEDHEDDDGAESDPELHDPGNDEGDGEPLRHRCQQNLQDEPSASKNC